MSKIALTRRVADQFGTSYSKAQRFVSDVGPTRVQRVLNRSGDATQSSRSFPWKTAIAGTTVAGIGGGTLYWREQDVRRVEAMSEEAGSYNEAMQAVIEADLPPELKQALAESTADVATNRYGGGGDDSGGLWDSFRSIFPSLGMGDPTTMVLAVIVVVMVLNHLLSRQMGVRTE